MSVINPNETSTSWHSSKRESTVQLYLSSIDAAAPELVGAKSGGMSLSLNIVPVTDWIDPDEVSRSVAAVIQVDSDHAASIKRFQKLAGEVETPLIAASYDPPLALVRSLVRAGAHDVIPLPVTVDDLETSLAELREELSKRRNTAAASNGKLVSVIKSIGGVGATAILTQLAIRFVRHEAGAGRDACLIDLDFQFGDAAFQLGLRPKFTLMDLLEAGQRLDGELLRATCTDHPSGLKVIAAPAEMIPIEGMPTDHLLKIIELARQEFDTVFVDLPANWTNWSLSVVAQSDLVLLVTELTVAGINRAKRQLQLLNSQDLSDVALRVVANRYEKSLARLIRPADVENALGREISYTIANDFPLMRSAIDRGLPIDDLKRKSTLGKDLDALDAGIAAALGLER
ncbi:MAG TPA: AAA family ATPase [Sphingomicrobium sp.]|nr:AAA family ATPase [Sphingomicrobium sp.]